MIILHILKNELWDKEKKLDAWGQCQLDFLGYIPCTTVDYLKYVAAFFENSKDKMVITCIDTNALSSPIKWEEWNRSGHFYPHIYGLVNMSSVIIAVPFIKDIDGHFIDNVKNMSIPNNTQ